MDIISELRRDLMEVLTRYGVEDHQAVTFERPKFEAHGELATNAAIVGAKQAKISPRGLAERLKSDFLDDDRVQKIEIAGPGFLNFVFQPSVWVENLRYVIQKGQDFGASNRGRGQRVLLEFVSANPTGPLHIGHARGAVFGDSLARLLEFTGFDVTREYYLNDGGAQVDTLTRSVYLRYLEALGQKINISKDHYRGDYLKSVGVSLAKIYQDQFVDQTEEEWFDLFREFSINEMVEFIQQDLQCLGIKMDHFFSEATLSESGKIDQAIDRLEQRGLIYRGELPPPKGGALDGWVPRQQKLFRSTRFGDDVDRPIQKSDDSWTYFAPDIAYHFDKISRGFDQLINVFGADHSGYIKRIRAVVMALSDDKVPIDIKVTQTVRVSKDGGAQKMSKRAGEFVQLREAVEAVGPDVTRFVMLMRKNDAQLDFDFDQVREQSADNPVFYVQYGHTRVCSALKLAAEKLESPVTDDDLAKADYAHLNHERQIALARRIAEWPRVVEQASRLHEPHRIVFFLYTVASEFHALWTLGHRQPELRIVQKGDPQGTLARLALARATAVAISSGLSILGVTPLKEMRG